MSYLVNTSISDTLSMRDDANEPMTGLVEADFETCIAYQVTDASVTANVTLAEVDDVTLPGVYSVTFTPTTPTSGNDKEWTVYVLYDTGGVQREFTRSWPISAIGVSVAPTYTTLGDIATVEQMMRATTTVTFDDDVVDRLTAVQALISEQLQYRLGRTFGTPASDTAEIVYAGAWPTLWLPRPARTITSVTAWGEIAGGTFSGGTTLTTSDYAHDPVEHDTGLIYGLRLIGGTWPYAGGCWGVDGPDGFGITPTEIVGDFSDSDDDAYVPADVNYAANLLILQTFRKEIGIPFTMVAASGLEIPQDPWKDPTVQLVLERYAVSGRDTRLVVW